MIADKVEKTFDVIMDMFYAETIGQLISMHGTLQILFGYEIFTLILHTNNGHTYIYDMEVLQ